MRMTIKSTSRIVRLDGVECRAWQGITDRAVRVTLYVARVEVDDSQDCSELDDELVETKPPHLVLA